MAEPVPIESDVIELAQLLKLANCVGTGGEAKLVIREGEVSVNGEIETRRGRKLRPGDIVAYSEQVFEVVQG
ncbi:MAG: RNA-binding protein [Candidatus Melainabacteria bacterium HGW-Melainabacteria-1]|nr:MAG: RNA-binding protein [Candidatus Melainabacteria bacterium HGW-Melainabacteria-1]